MDDVFNPQPQDEEATPPQLEESEKVAEPEAQPQAENQVQGSPTEPNTKKLVPLDALEAERKQRQDWKEKFIRLEAEIQTERNLRREQQPQEPQEPQDPLKALQQQILNERFNTSEMLARQKYADIDDHVNSFKEAAQKNPALISAMYQSQHPWEFAYNEGKRMKLVAEIGNDPDAYRARIEAEIMAKLQATPAPAAAPIPQSLAGARSVAGRSASSFTGPAPLGSLFKN